MPQYIVFPCPHCGASQNVEDSANSTQCQFCGNTITVPEQLRPKPAQPGPPAAPPQSFSFGGAAGMPGMAGMAGMPGMFLNMDIGKLRAMAMAARAGDKAEAARLYQETFGVSPEAAMEAADLMANHHHIVLSQMQMGAPPGLQLGNAPPAAIYSRPSPTYNLPSPPVTTSRQGSGGRWAACFAVALLLLIGVVTAGIIIAAALSRAR